MNKKVILTTAAVLATVATAGGVKADELNGDLTKDSIGLTAETGNSTSATIRCRKLDYLKMGKRDTSNKI